jgi:DNA (cytosine-5)-methyltransferase 3A
MNKDLQPNGIPSANIATNAMLSEGIIVISLFDGMSCGQIALQDMGVKVKQYYAAEIDKHAIAQTQLNFPNTIQLGSVTDWQKWDIDWQNVGLILAGSPCQGFSFAGKQLAFDDPRSKLFFVFIDILKHTQKHNPSVKYLLENVKMAKEHELVISRYCNVAPIEINSALVSAQNRQRLYWTNIANNAFGLFGDMVCSIPQPKDKGILLKDILESDVAEKFYLSEKMLKWLTKHSEKRGSEFKKLDGNQKASCLTTTEAKQNLSNDYICVASRGRNPENPKSREAGLNTEQMLEPRYDGKTNCITSVSKDNLVMQLNGNIESGGKQPYQQNRVYDTNGISPALMAQMSCGSHAILVPEATKKGFIEVKPGECFDFENPNSETRQGRKMEDKSNCLMAKETDFMQYTNDFKIRRLTPTECSRLQTIPSWYKWQCSDTQQYRMLGNGWTVEVIKHILSFMNKE